MAMITLNRLPGAYWPWITRFMRGVAGSVDRRLQRAGSTPVEKMLGSYPGVEVMARISPVSGSRAMALPARPWNAWSMAFCRSLSRVRVRFGPSTGGCRSVSATSIPRLFTMSRLRPSRPIKLRLYCDSTPACPTRSPGARSANSADWSWRSLTSPTRPREWAAAEARG